MLNGDFVSKIYPQLFHSYSQGPGDTQICSQKFTVCPRVFHKKKRRTRIGGLYYTSSPQITALMQCNVCAKAKCYRNFVKKPDIALCSRTGGYRRFFYR